MVECNLAKVDVASSSLVTRSLFLQEGLPHFRNRDYKQFYKQPRRFLIWCDDVFHTTGKSSEDVARSLRPSQRCNNQPLDESGKCTLVQLALSGDADSGQTGSLKLKGPSGVSLRAESRLGQCRTGAVPSRAQGRIPALAEMPTTSQKKRSVDSDTYTVQPGSEQSTQASLEDYELSSQRGRTRLSPKRSLKRLGESRSGNTGQLSYGDVASLYETLAPLVEIARLLKERRPDHGEAKRGVSVPEPEQPSLKKR